MKRLTSVQIESLPGKTANKPPLALLLLPGLNERRWCADCVLLAAWRADIKVKHSAVLCAADEVVTSGRISRGMLADGVAFLDGADTCVLLLGRGRRVCGSLKVRFGAFSDWEGILGDIARGFQFQSGGGSYTSYANWFLRDGALLTELIITILVITANESHKQFGKANDTFTQIFRKYKRVTSILTTNTTRSFVLLYSDKPWEY